MSENRENKRTNSGLKMPVPPVSVDLFTVLFTPADLISSAEQTVLSERGSLAHLLHSTLY